MNNHFNRRDFLKTSAAGLSFAFTLAADPRALISAAAAADAPLSASAWITIATDGTITIVSPAAEMVHGYFKALRIAGAQARRVLLDAIAAKWNVPTAELSTEPSVVVHKASNRRMSYGEIAGFAKAPAEMPKIEDKDLKL